MAAAKRQQKKIPAAVPPVPVVDPSRRERLLKARDLLETQMFAAEPNVLAMLVGQYRQILKEIDELPDESVQSDWDKARAMRAQRRAGLKAV